MDGDGESKKVDSQSQIQKQKEALEKAKSVVQRPVVQKTVPPDPVARQTHPTFITYPEFAPASSQSPKALLTLRRLLLVLYLCAGTATTIYAVSKIFLQPLMRQVVQARREYYQHAVKKLEALTLNLSGIHDTLRGSPTTADKATEHSVPLIADSEVDTITTETSKISEGLNKVAQMIASESNSGETAAHNELSFATEDLIVYLNNHVYMATPFVGYGAGYSSGFGQGSEESAKNDIVNRVKTEIRSVKGAVLNIRNFPAPGGGLKVA